MRLQNLYPQRARWSRKLERLALAVERPLNRLIGSTQLNPFYHTGPIAVFLLLVVAVTGFYLFLFFQYGFEDSYNAVVNRIEAPFIARIVRAIHRYASDALVITTLLHAFRILFMERFRGPRWLAWMTGIVMTFILWLDGVTGYWLVWDQRAQLINEQFVSFLAQLSNWTGATWAADYQLTLLRAELSGESWPILLLIFAAHVGLFVITAVFFYLHIRHLARPRWFPEPVWMLGAIAVLFIISALFPAGLLPWFDPTQLPGEVLLDPVYLYYLPLNETQWANWLWAFMWIATFAAAALPWLKTRRQKASAKATAVAQTAQVQINNNRCTGCTKCADDCPYGAIQMVDRDDDSGHQLLAVADPSKCVGCGICVGSCNDFYAISVGDLHPFAAKTQLDHRLNRAKALHPDKAVKIIFTCQRHAVQGAAPYLDSATINNGLAIETIALPCSGAIQPTLLPYALAQGAAEVEVVGCPPYDCANRLGNMLEAERVTNERVPRLRRRYDHVPITAVWLPPDEFDQALAPTTAPAGDKPNYRDTRAMFRWLSWRNVLAGVILLALVLLGQIWLTGLPFTPYPDPPAIIQISVQDPGRYLLGSKGAMMRYDPNAWLNGSPTILRLEIDGQTAWETTYDASQFFPNSAPAVYAKIEAEPSLHDIHLYWINSSSNFQATLYKEKIRLNAGQILRLHELAQ